MSHKYMYNVKDVTQIHVQCKKCHTNTDPSKCINDQTLRSDREFCRTSHRQMSDQIVRQMPDQIVRQMSDQIVRQMFDQILPGRSDSLHSQIVKL